MEAPPSASDYENAWNSWHPTMRPNSHRVSELSGEPTNQSPSAPSHPADNKSEAELFEQPPNGLNDDETSGREIPILMEEDDKKSTSAEKTAQSDIWVGREADDSASVVDGQKGNTEVQNAEVSEGALGKAYEGGGAGFRSMVSDSQSGPSRRFQSQNLLAEGDSVRTEPAAAPGSATSPTEIGNAMGGEEEMAKAWDSEPSYAWNPRPGDVSRTNSFPRVPPLSQTGSIPLQSLSHSQAEDIMEDDKDIEPMDRLPSLDSLTVANPSGADGGAQQRPFEASGDKDDNFFVNLKARQVADPVLQADDESRFEEGLPLMHAPDHFSAKDQTHGAGALRSSDAEDDDDILFDETSQPMEAPSFRPQALDRKSTTQVLDSLHYAPHGITHGESPGAGEKLPLVNLAGEEAAGSSNTTNSQTYAEQQTETIKAQPEDQDLSEMWKAALGDDDLLEDNEGLLDPSSFFEDDGEGFLDGGEDQMETQLQAITWPQGSDVSMAGDSQIGSGQPSSRDKYLPNATPQPLTANPKYSYGHSNGAPTHQPLHVPSGLAHPASAPGSFTHTNRQPTYAAHTSPSRPQLPPSTQSFADKSKGGYTSPYDLPMDVTRPKKRTPHQQLRPKSDVQVAPNRPPPPRSSSMFTGALPPLDAGPPAPRLPSTVTHLSTGNDLRPPLKALSSKGTFFEELPSSKPRPSSSMGQVAYSTSQPSPPPPMSLQRDPPRQVSMTQQPSPEAVSNPQQHQLLPPERMSLYASAPHSEPGNQILPVANARYSPAPVQQSNVPPPRNRYAASPSIASRPAPSQTLSFQPRTSSPLAQSSSSLRANHQPSVSDPSLHRPATSGRQDASANAPVSSSSSPSHHSANTTGMNAKQNESIREVDNNSQFRHSPPPPNPAHYAPFSNSSADSSYAMNTQGPDHPITRGFESVKQPQESPMNVSGASARGPPPRRSQSQSPEAGKHKPGLPQSTQNQYQRPASVNDRISLPSVEIRPSQTRQRERTFTKDLNYIRPSDGREMDPLERWKGCPIITFGFGGTIVTNFPKQVPRYAAGQSIPMIKCSPGEVKIQDGKFLPLAQDIASFPGPLKSKSKKRDILDWLQTRIAHLESSGVGHFGSATLPDPKKRNEEKLLLWKIVRVIVEHDGAVDSNTSADSAIRSILSPELTVGDTASPPSRSFNSSLLGISRNSGSHYIREPMKPEAMEDLRKLLLHGERAKAVWHAVDNQLWAHAMLLASTLEKDVWRQVSQEFVRQEVKTFGNNTESLAALYQIFAGNWDESMDELVPPSARAGLQLVSKTATTGPTRNALDGLDRWRETLTLILSNRSVDDGRALMSLGQLLAGYGRIEAAHICYIFAKSPALFGGPDDPQVGVALLGADHSQQPFDYGRDLDCILLTEVYDFALTVLATSSAVTVSPHLQSYKLYHAMILAEYGYKSEAQQYCEMIASALNSTTKRSPYYHSLLFGALENLADRLRQAPRDNPGSWISKPSIDKVSGSIWAKFNQYVAGDESDALSTGSGKAYEQEIGPFARVSGDSPNLSRTPSSSDMYSAHAPGIGVSQVTPANSLSNSRYAPTGLYTPRSSLEQPGNSSQDYQRSMQAQKDSLRPVFAQQQYQSRPVSSNGSYHDSFQPSSYPPRAESYLPTPPSQPEYMPVAPPEETSSSLYQQNPPLDPEPPREEHKPQTQSELAGDYQPSSTTYEPPSYTYESPSTSSYQPPPMDSYNPPEYEPYVPQGSESPVEEKPKKKLFMDNDADDDFEARAAALRKEEKARKDREADDAFRRAAEADAQRDNAPKLNSKKSGWFGGWLGSKKEGDAAEAHGTPNAPIKAKLGEQNSFYYDSEKKRWVNKKDPDGTAAAAPAPPPPKGPPSRAVSAAGPPRPNSTAPPPVPPLPMAGATPPINVTRPTTSTPPLSNLTSQYPSRSPSPAVKAPTTTEGALIEPSEAPMLLGTDPHSGPPSAPPSRPATGMSGASSIDDLIGVPQARKGGTVRKGKKGRGYVDVMAK